MKKAMRLAIVATALVPMFLSKALAEKLEGVEVTKTAAAVNFTQIIDVSRWNGYSAQAIYSDGTPSTHSVASGSRASATMTIGPNPTGLFGVQASVTINIKSTTTITGKSVTINGVVFTAGTDFTGAGVSTSVAATNLQVRVDAHPDFVATVAGATVTVKYATYGTPGNGLPIVTSASANFGLSAATLTGGANQYSFFINGSEFKEGTHWSANSASSQTIAINISTSVNADTRVNTSVIASTTSLGVVTITALLPGYSNYNLTSSSATGLVTSIGLPGGLASDVDITNDLFNKVGHSLTTGLRVLAATVVGTAPTGLTSQTTYYAIKLNENQYALATTSTTAVAGTKIDITGITNSSTMDIKPLALSTATGTGFFFEAGNSTSSFTGITGATINGVAVSSVTYTAAGNTIWDFGTLNYRYLRFNYIGPTNGGIALSVKIFGKKD